MSYREPDTRPEPLENELEDVVPTQRRPRLVREGSLTPPPSRLAPGESRRVDMKAILSEPPRLAGDAGTVLPPPPRVPELNRSVVLEDEWKNDRTPPPMSFKVTSEGASILPVAISEAPPSAAPVPRITHTAWTVAVGGLAATLGVAAAVWLFVPTTARSGPAPAAALATEPPLVAIDDLPVVGVVEEPDVALDLFLVDEVPISATPPAPPRSERPIRPDRERQRALPPLAPPSEQVAATGAESPVEAEPIVAGDVAEPEPPAALPPFDRQEASATLDAAASHAASCRRPGTPAGTVRVSVTLAPSGRATTATVDGAFAGTEVGGCIARTFRSVRVQPFDGPLVTLRKTVTIR